MNFLAFRLDFVAFVIWHGWFQAVPFGSTRDSATEACVVDESPSQSTRFDLLHQPCEGPSASINCVQSPSSSLAGMYRGRVQPLNAESW
jgi:hypothetical protein